VPVEARLGDQDTEALGQGSTRGKDARNPCLMSLTYSARRYRPPTS
jgi:hypothetical protein